MIMHAGEILKRRGLLNEEQLSQSRDRDATGVIQAAIALGFVEEREALQALAKKWAGMSTFVRRTSISRLYRVFLRSSFTGNRYSRLGLRVTPSLLPSDPWISILSMKRVPRRRGISCPLLRSVLKLPA